MRLPKNQRKPIGHAGEDARPVGTGGRHRVSGHALASSERGWIPAQRDQAASDDTRRASAAMDASSIIAPGTDCVEYAEVAPPRSNGDLVHVAVNPPEHVVQKEVIPGGGCPVPHGPSQFVEEIHRNADLFIVWQS